MTTLAPRTTVVRERGLSPLAHGSDRLLDLAVAALASWTVVYHVCLLTGLDVPGAVAIEVIALLVGGVLWWRGHRGSSAAPDEADLAPEMSAPDPGDTSRERRILLIGSGACAVLAAVLFAVDASWPATAAAWMLAALGASVWAVRELVRRPPAAPGSQSRDVTDPLVATGGQSRAAVEQTRWSDGSVVALAWAFVLAALSLHTLRPNPDDLYYVNMAQWVADHGTYPLRDTIFSDQVFPMSSWPPMASYDALTGTIARLVGVHAASVVYLVVPPVATFLSVLALWRLLRAWRVTPVWVALSVSLVFLLLDGDNGYGTPGNLFLTRLWQGKVILLCLMVPILLVYALRYVERPTRGRAGWLFAGGVAAVGLTTSAIFLVPLIAAAGAAPLAVRSRRRALRGFAAMAAYPLLAGAVTVAIHGHSADDFDSRRLYRFDPSWFGHEVFQSGVLALVAVSAVLLEAFLIPHRSARVTTALLTVITGVTFIPGVTHLSYDLLGLGPTLWRVSWVASVAALVGVLAAAAAANTRRRRLRIVGPALVVVALLLGGTPIWSGSAGVAFEPALHWQRSPESMAAARAAIAALEPGDVVLAPEDLAITIDVMTTRVKTVAPRAYFMDYLRGEDGFHYAERLTLVDLADLAPGEAFDQVAVARALAVVDVAEVCLPVEDLDRLAFVRAIGYRLQTGTPRYICLTREAGTMEGSD